MNLSALFQNKFIISLAVALIVSVYAWKTIPPPGDTSKASPGAVALRLFFVTFLSVYLLSFLLEYYDGSRKPIVGGGSKEVSGLRHALKQIDHGAPDF